MNKKIFLFLIFVTTIIKAQDQLDSLDFIKTTIPQNILYSKFDKQLNTFNLHSALLYNNKFDKINLHLNEDYNSTYVRSYDNSNRDEQTFTVSGSYAFNPVFSTGISANNNIYSDSRKIEINQASLSDAIVFSQVTPFDYLLFVPYLGYENNRQIGESDNGPVYGGEAYLDNLSVSDFTLRSDLKFKNEDISPRKNALRYFNLAVTNSFNPVVSNSINFQYFQNRKDFYYAADSITAKEFNVINNIQSRIETNNILQDKFNYNKFLSIFSLDLLGRVSWRTIDRNTRYRSLDVLSTSNFDSKINELKVEFESVTNYNSDFFDGTLRIDYSERDEKHVAKNYPGANQIFYQERADQESIKNNTAKRESISLLGKLNFSQTDKLYFSLFQNKLSYDTPSPENFDDRDELLSIVRLKYIKTLSPFFSVFVNTEGTYNHVVYIFSERSSNNNVNRILKLSSGGIYSGKYFISSNSFEVSANYTVYDFEDITPNYRSFSFRQFSATDSSKINLSQRIDFVHYGYIKLSEQGDLKWASFSTHPTRFLQEIYSEPKFIFYQNNLSFTFGFRVFSLNTYNYQGLEKVIDSKYLSIAPLSEISININKLTFNLLGWYEFISIDNSSDRQQANITMTMNWNF